MREQEYGEVTFKVNERTFRYNERETLGGFRNKCQPDCQIAEGERVTIFFHEDRILRTERSD